MSVVTEVSPNGQKLTISIKGRFDFAKHQEFRESYEDKELSAVVVDLKEATYLDSSALGMLLLLRDHAGGDGHEQVVGPVLHPVVAPGGGASRCMRQSFTT